MVGPRYVLFISGSAIKNPIPLLERIAAPLIAQL
jgi:hypothetical protein